MAKSATDLSPRQERSRESLRKLLKAATEVLGQHGVDGTTIPRIAEHAGLTPGAVYRRFRDKDALLEAAILGILERQEERLKAGLTPATASKIPLEVFIEQIVGGMIVTYRANAPLLRALRQFTQGRLDTEFARKAARLEVRSIERVVELILAHRKDIRHPDPRVAVPLALVMLVSTLYEVVVSPAPMKEVRSLFPKDDPALKRELTRAFLSYLEVGRPPRRTAS